jgi:hypothetical protein
MKRAWFRKHKRNVQTILASYIERGTNNFMSVK